MGRSGWHPLRGPARSLEPSSATASSFERAAGAAAALFLLATASACRGKTEEKPAAQQPTAAAMPTAAKPQPTAARATPAPPPPEPPAPTEAPTAAPAEPPAGTTELELLGVVRGTASSPSALIGLGGRQEIFRKGDSVFGEGTLRELRDDAVVVRKGGRDLVLEMQRPPAAPPTPGPAVADIAPPKSEPPPAAPMSQPISRAEARAALRDLGSLLQEAKAQSAEVGGGRGVALGQVESGSFLAEIGLKSGDILQRIGGVALGDPKNVPDLSSAADGDALAVTFVRDQIGLTLRRPLR